jgi:Omp85 superfamily domain
VRTPLLVAGLTVCCVAHAKAQVDASISDYWLDVFYPKLFYTSRDGFTGGGYFAFVQPVRFEDFESPPPYRAAVSLDAQVSASGSRFASLEARFPQFVPGWRFTGILSAKRDARDSYFGIGSSATYEGDNVTDNQPHFYQALHNRILFRAEVQRYVIGPLRLLAGVDAQRWKIEPLDGPSVLAADAQSAADPTIGVGTTDISARFGFLFDSRDSEVYAARGVLITLVGTGASESVAGDVSYSRLTFSAEAHVPVTSALNVAGRFVASGMGGKPPLGSLYQITQTTFTGFGGATSHRALRTNRYLGRHQLLGNVDVRYTLWELPTVARLSAIGFFDVGRVFEGEPFRLTTEDLQAGAGGGFFVQLGRAGVVGLTGAGGPDGFVLHFHSRWPY